MRRWLIGEVPLVVVGLLGINKKCFFSVRFGEGGEWLVIWCYGFDVV